MWWTSKFDLYIRDIGYFCVIYLEDNSFFILDVLFEARINGWTNIFDNISHYWEGGHVIEQTMRGRYGKWMSNIVEVLFKLIGPLKRQHFLVWVKTTSYKYRLPNGSQSDQTKLLHLICHATPAVSNLRLLTGNLTFLTRTITRWVWVGCMCICNMKTTLK